MRTVTHQNACITFSARAPNVFTRAPVSKDSLFGDAKAYGPQSVAFFTREKAITSRWLDPSHGGINLGFPQN